MTQTADTTVTQTPSDTTATTAPAAPAAPKAPSKKSQADAIFAAALVMRAEGKFDSNKAFRAHVLSTIEAQLGVSTASAATMYNSAKKAAEAADATVGLGRDPKKEKPAKGTGKRGRPAGSKNKPKADAAAPAAEGVVVTADATADGVVLTAVEGQPAADTPADAPAADAAPAEAAA